MKTSRMQFKPISLTRIAVAGLLVCGGLAQAQTGPGVTLYGLADVGVTRVSGLKGGTMTQLSSGIMEGSRWGLKGTEDMGGGYKAIFTLEARVELDTGSNSNRPASGSQLSDRFAQSALLFPSLPAPVQAALQPIVTAVGGALANEFGVNVGSQGNRAFDRQAFVGLITPGGAVLAGRMYTPAFETNSVYDIMETQSGLAAGQIVAFPAVLEIRKSNALQYRFVKDGVSGAFMYALGEQTGGNSQKRMIGFNANYKTDLYSVGLGYNRANNELGAKSLTTTVLGASMNLGASKVSAMAIKITDDNPSDMSQIGALLSANPQTAPYAGTVQAGFTNAFKQDGLLMHVGYRHVMGPHTLSVAYTNYNDKRPANADVASYGLAYTYALSKRTDLNAVLVRYNNDNLAQVAPGGNGYIGGVTATAGTDSTGMAFGIRHRF